MVCSRHLVVRMLGLDRKMNTSEKSINKNITVFVFGLLV